MLFRCSNRCLLLINLIVNISVESVPEKQLVRQTARDRTRNRVRTRTAYTYDTYKHYDINISITEVVLVALLLWLLRLFALRFPSQRNHNEDCKLKPRNAFNKFAARVDATFNKAIPRDYFLGEKKSFAIARYPTLFSEPSTIVSAF